jgi:hypothetical protein
MKTCLFVVLGMFLLLICACVGGYGYLYYRYPPKHWEPRFGRETNPARMKLGIPVIPADWKPYASQYETVWRSPHCKAEEDVTQRKLGDRLEPCHMEKWVRYWPEDYPESNQIPSVIEEMDSYRGPGYVDILGELEHEFVNIRCRYNPNDPTWKECQAWALVDHRFVYGGGGAKVDLNTAMEILSEWGITNP